MEKKLVEMLHLELHVIRLYMQLSSLRKKNLLQSWVFLIFPREVQL